MVVLIFALAEEIGMRGYLQPHLMSLGRTRALFLVGLVFATWHMPLILLTPALIPRGQPVALPPLFYGTVVAASFFYGYFRIYTGSTWPASIAHAVHNAVWGGWERSPAASSAVLVNMYLVGDFGLLILVGAVIGAIGVGYYLRRGMNKAQSDADAEVPRVAPAHPSAPAAPTR